MESIGIGIVTCNRRDFFDVCWNSIPEEFKEHTIVYNDGEQFDHESDPIWNGGGAGVAVGKNTLMKALLAKRYEYIFIIEDDMRIKRADIFDAYINAYKVSGIQHFMFAYHGPANKGGVSGGPPKPKYVINYPGQDISINQNCVGAFCMYTGQSLIDVGLMDIKFHNAFEHVEHSYQLAKQGFSTPYWNWADLANSCDYIEEQACSEVNSSIRYKDPSAWHDNITRGIQYFKQKHGVEPFGPEGVPDISEKTLVGILKILHTFKDK